MSNDGQDEAQIEEEREFVESKEAVEQICE